jgi:hypothetical protein
VNALVVFGERLRILDREGRVRIGSNERSRHERARPAARNQRYMAKPEEFPEGLETGRIWGIWDEELLPVRWETVQVSIQDAYRIRRIYRKLAGRKGTGSLRRITVFVRHENVVRILRFMGYRLE